MSEIDLDSLCTRAERGDAEAQFQLGGRHYVGAEVPQNFAEAAKWFRLAAKQGHPSAQFNLGYMFAEGEGVSRDLAEARKLYQLAAQQGLMFAQNNLGRLYEQAENYLEAAKWYALAAEQGYSPSQCSLAFAFSNGRGVSQNVDEAVRLNRSAAEQGSVGAQYNLGSIYMNGKGAVAPNWAEAAKWFRLAAEQGNIPSQNMLGYMCAEGVGVPKNFDEALKWNRLAGVQGDTEAQYRIGVHYCHGLGVRRNNALAYMWFALAAAKGSKVAAENEARVDRVGDSQIYGEINEGLAGNVDAQRNLAQRLHNGEGIQKDETAASIWLRMAAHGGDAWAQTTLAIQLRTSKDPEKERESIRWLALAAEEGDSRARFNLGLQQWLGIGTPTNRESATANMIIASLAGFDDARRAFENDIRTAIPESSWSAIFDQVKWPRLTFFMGPLVRGHLDEIRTSQESDDGSENAPWLKYERECWGTGFPFLVGVFGEQEVSVKKFTVDRGMFKGKPVAAINIIMRDVVLKDGFPVYWEPSIEAIDAMTSVLAVISAREWVNWHYLRF